MIGNNFFLKKISFQLSISEKIMFLEEQSVFKNAAI